MKTTSIFVICLLVALFGTSESRITLGTGAQHQSCILDANRVILGVTYHYYTNAWFLYAPRDYTAECYATSSATSSTSETNLRLSYYSGYAFQGGYCYSTGFRYCDVGSGNSRDTARGRIPADYYVSPVSVNSVPNGACTNTYTMRRTFEANCPTSGDRQVSHLITTVDTQPPYIRAPPSTTIDCSVVGVPDLSLTGDAYAYDLCSGVSTTFQTSALTRTGCVGSYTRTFHATDGCARSSSDTQTIFVRDTTAPQVQSPYYDGTVWTRVCTAPSPPVVTLLDNCFSGTITASLISTKVIEQTCPNRYTVEATYAGSDGCSTTNSKVYLTAFDNQPPTITNFPPSQTTPVCLSAVTPITNLLISDNCGSVVSSNSTTITPGTTVGTFAITRTVVATDACGNTAQRTSTIAVDDNTNAVFSTPLVQATCTIGSTCSVAVTLTRNSGCTPRPAIVFDPYPAIVGTISGCSTDPGIVYCTGISFASSPTSITIPLAIPSTTFPQTVVFFVEAVYTNQRNTNTSPNANFAQVVLTLVSP